MSAGLEIENLSVVRAGSRVVRNVTIAAPAGEVTVIVGPNGAGKTSLMEAVSGIIRPSEGEIRLDGQRLHRHSRVQRANAGLSHVEQGRTIFGHLTVEENLRVVGDPGEAWALFPQLRDRSASLASSLSGGEQQMLVIARGLLRRPRVLLIDEVSQGAGASHHPPDRALAPRGGRSGHRGPPGGTVHLARPGGRRPRPRHDTRVDRAVGSLRRPPGRT
jgi:branched-chain amino acid transport system ATP-binding protein